VNERGETEYREENLDDQVGIFLLESEFRVTSAESLSPSYMDAIREEAKIV